MINGTSLFKKRGMQEMGNYRPVNLISFAGKILEFIIKEVIMKVLEAHGKIRLSEHDFVKGRLCLINLLEFFDEVMNKSDKGLPVDVIYLDFRKAFHKVPHRRLLNKSPWKDVLALKGVQMWFTRMVLGMKGMSYEKRLKTLGLYLIEFRTMRWG
eukprot:g38601.t1